jgi:hypothetical protein
VAELQEDTIITPKIRFVCLYITRRKPILY